jgi:fimbrial isopeptide formation D2 family protein/LPXTG-motif cell wall-anchored protein
MKRTKRIFAIFMTLALAMSMLIVSSAVSFAAAPPTSQTIKSDSAADADGKYTISVADSDTHSYTVYQILTGTLTAGESKLGNPAWGSDAKGGENNSVKDFIDSITQSGLTNNQINDLVKAQLKDGATGVGTVNASTPLNVVPGYYFIVDTTASLEEGDAKSLNIVAVFNDIELAPKKDTVESEKHVDDVNDSDASDHSELKDSADYDIGDSVPYTLTFTLPDDYANYKQYHVSFLDDMSKGLTYNGDAKIYYGAADTAGTDIGTSFAPDTSAASAYEGGKVYKYTIANLKADDATAAQKALKAGDVITIKYTATLNSDAVIGSAGNPNEYHVKYSSNPNQEAEGTPDTNTTPEDVNIVFTYKTVFNKVDGNGKPLTGADFTLYKKVGSTWVDVTALNSGADAANPTKTKEAFSNAKGEAANAKFTFSGLDAGDYKLVETTTPTGYNTIADVEFTITATHDLVSDDPKLTSLTGTDGAEFTMTSDVTAGSLTAVITNQSGAELPSTGGIGTVIFYVLGSLLVVGCGIVLISKRRMESR